MLAQPNRLSYRFATDGSVGQEDLAHIMELRVAVEVVATELAAQRRNTPDITAMRRALTATRAAVRDASDGSEADDQFHYAIAAVTQNPHLKRFVEFLRHQFGATRRTTWAPGRIKAARRQSSRPRQRQTPRRSRRD